MLENSVKWAILGTSAISAVLAKAIKNSSSSELIAVGSRSFSRAKAFAETYSVPHFYGDYHQLLANTDIDAVYIGLPNHLHKEWIIHAARAGKHILCEKPLVISVEEARDVISFVQEKNLVCMEALMYRCHPFTKKMQDIIAQKRLGEIKLYQATYTANIAAFANPVAGGSIRNLGCYPISLIRLLAKGDPIEMRAIGSVRENQIDHQASVILKFADNAIAVISTADDMEMRWQFDIYGTAGYLKVMTNPWLPDEHNNKVIVHQNDHKDPEEMTVTTEKPLYTHQIDVVNLRIKHKGQNPEGNISLSDSLATIRLLEKWREELTFNSSFSLTKNN